MSMSCVPDPQGMWDQTERAQVYARDLRRPADSSLTFLRRGGKQELRDAAQAGHLVCPMPGCDQPLLQIRAGSRRDHFAHRRAPTIAHGIESLMHLQGKAMIAGWLSANYPDLRVAVERRVGEKRVADVLAVDHEGKQIVFEVQYAQLTVEEWTERHLDYERHGVLDIWLWGHVPPHCRRVRGGERLERAITPAMRVYHDLTGRPLIWINPEEQLLAVGAMRDDLPLRAWSAAFFEWRSAIAHPTPLAGWSLQDTGLVSKTTTAILDRRRAIELAREQEERRKAEQQAHREWLARTEVEREERRAAYEARDQEHWNAIRDQLVARIGELPSALSHRLPADRAIFLHHEHWHALVYEAHIARRTRGECFSYADMCRTVLAVLRAERKPIPDRRATYRAVTGLLFHLRRSGLVWFQADGYWIGGPIMIA